MITLGAFLTSSLYELVSFPLYIRIIFILFKKDEFKNPFCRLILINGILDVCHCLITIVFYRLPIFTISKDLFTDAAPSRIISAIIVCYFSMIYQIFFLHVSISLNRLTCISAPFFHKKFWDKWWPAVPLVGFCLSICFTFHRIFSIGQYVGVNNGSCGFTPIIVKYDFYMLNQNLLTASFGTISLLACMFTNGWTFIKILLRKHANKNKSLQSSFKNEMHLFIVSLWMMAFMCIFIIFEIALWGGFFSVDSCFLLSQLPWVEDSFSLSQPWVLILANKGIREAALPWAKTGHAKVQQVRQQQNIVTVTVLPFKTDQRVNFSSKSM